jgi:MraZ protein
VAFVGRGHFFQIWEPERLKAYGAEARSRLVRLRHAATLRRVAGDTE